MKKIFFIVISIFVVIWFSSRSCSSCASNSYAGTYVADLTIMQSGKVTTFIINSDGTAVVIDNNGSKRQTYWDEFEENVIVVHGEYAQYDKYMDFENKMIYVLGYSNYRSKKYGYPFRRK